MVNHDKSSLCRSQWFFHFTGAVKHIEIKGKNNLGIINKRKTIFPVFFKDQNLLLSRQPLKKLRIMIWSYDLYIVTLIFKKMIQPGAGTYCISIGSFMRHYDYTICPGQGRCD